MELIQIEDFEEKQDLRKQCRFIDDALDTDVYALLDDNDPKTVFTLKRIGDYTQPISTVRQLDFETKPDAQHSDKKYATRGFEQMLKIIQERPDISEVYIDAANPISGRIAEKFGLESTEMGRYLISNPNFDVNYETVCDMIKSGVPVEQIQAFSTEKGLSTSQINTWLEIQSTLPQIEKNEFEIPIFTPPETTNDSLDINDKTVSEIPVFTPPGNQEHSTENKNDTFIINEFGEIERPTSRLESLAQQKFQLQSLLRERETELKEMQSTRTDKGVEPHEI